MENKQSIILYLFYIVIGISVIVFGFSIYRESTNFYLNKNELKLSLDSSYQVTITGKKVRNSDNKYYSYKSDNEKILTVDSLGNITPKSTGSTYIVVKSKINFMSKKFKVTIIDDPVKLIDVENKNIVITEGEKYNLNSVVNNDNSIFHNLSYSSSDNSIASVDKNGIITGLAVGQVTITIKANNGITGECYVSVTARQVSEQTSNTEEPTTPPKPNTPVQPSVVYPTGISLNSSSINIKVGSKTKISATVYPSNATDKTVIWSSSNNNIVSVDNGTIKAISIGKATITAKTSNGKYVNCVVNVTNNNVDVSSISLNSTSTNMYIGGTLSLTATVLPSNATDKTITWSSSDTSVAIVSNGFVTAKKAGKTTITAKTHNGKTATCIIVVTEVPVSGVTLNMSSKSVYIGDTFTLTATVSPNNATNKSVTWSSSNTGVATVTNGYIVAKKAGTATITATAGGKKASMSLTVLEKPIVPSSISLDKTSVSIFDAKTSKVTATVLPSNAANKSVTWSSANPNIAKISNGTITAVSPGTTTITASTSNGKTASVKVTVKAYNIVMIGNSKTYYYQLNEIYGSMIKNRGISANMTYITKGGKSLSWHYTNNKTSINKSYDIAILQEKTDNVELGSAYNAEVKKTYYQDYLDGATNISKLLKKNNSNVKLYIRQTWSLNTHRSGTDDKRKTIYSSASKIASANGASVIKDGEAWDKSYNLYPNFNLYSDVRHQNYNGAYLAAACIYKKTFGDPTGITYYGKLSKANATKMLSVANSTC